jgi:hypothetical protein
VNLSHTYELMNSACEQRYELRGPRADRQVRLLACASLVEATFDDGKERSFTSIDRVTPTGQALLGAFKDLPMTRRNNMKQLLLIVAIALTCALTGTPRASGQSAQFVYLNFSGNLTPGSTLSFDTVLNFGAGGSVTNLNGLSYWVHEVTSPGGASSLSITLRDVTGSLFDDLQSPSITYPQNLDPINRNANGTQNSTDFGALCSNALPSGSYFIAHLAISISADALPGMYTIENTTAGTPGVGGRISVITDDQGTTFPITASRFSFEIPPAPTPKPKKSKKNQ